MDTLLELKDICKVFDGVPVLKGIDMTLRAGEVHALLGGNGSGKSTLMKIISGIHTADKGDITYLGKPVAFTKPYQAHKAGIYLVPQEPKVFPYLSILENITMGLSRVDSECVEKAKAIVERIGFNVPLGEYAGRLTIANQQLLEIIRGLLRDSKVLILDEPTSTLTVKEVEALFSVVRPLVEGGIGVFFISHRINEIFEFADRVTVFRDGSAVLAGNISDYTQDDLINAMIGKPSQAAKREERSYSIGDVVMQVNGLSSEAFKDVTFSLRKSETLGIAGIVGAGRTELALAIMGREDYYSGEVLVGGKKLARMSPESSRQARVAYIPEDRHKYGIFLDAPFYETTTASILKSISKFFLSSKSERSIARNYVDELKIKVSSENQHARMLSGGNQQKTVLSKILATEPKIVILDEPTRGIDAAAREDVFKIVDKLKEEGISVILISSDLDEVINNSDRIIVLYCGEINMELERKDFSIEKITKASFGVV